MGGKFYVPSNIVSSRDAPSHRQLKIRADLEKIQKRELVVTEINPPEKRAAVEAPATLPTLQDVDADTLFPVDDARDADNVNIEQDDRDADVQVDAESDAEESEDEYVWYVGGCQQTVMMMKRHCLQS